VRRLPPPNVYSAPLTGALLSILGIAALILLALMPATLGVGWLAFALLGLPLAVGGACGALIGYGVLSTRVEIAPSGVVIAAPRLARLPLPAGAPIPFQMDGCARRAPSH
jgi:hypothetical protein